MSGIKFLRRLIGHECRWNREHRVGRPCCMRSRLLARGAGAKPALVQDDVTYEWRVAEIGHICLARRVDDDMGGLFGRQWTGRCLVVRWLCVCRDEYAIAFTIPKRLPGLS